MSKSCFKCDNCSKIRINRLSYCTDCFIDNFLTKFSRNIMGTTPNTRVCLLLPNTACSLLVHTLIQEYFKDRKIIDLTVIHNEIDIIKDDKFRYLHTKNSLSIENFEDLENYDLILIAEPMEIQLSKALKLICQGEGRKSVELYDTEKKIRNVLQDVKTKEVLYYMYVKNILRASNTMGLCRIEETLLDFLFEIDSKNSLTLFNVSNTFKKLLKKQ